MQQTNLWSVARPSGRLWRRLALGCVALGVALLLPGVERGDAARAEAVASGASATFSLENGAQASTVVLRGVPEDARYALEPSFDRLRLRLRVRGIQSLSQGRARLGEGLISHLRPLQGDEGVTLDMRLKTAAVPNVTQSGNELRLSLRAIDDADRGGLLVSMHTQHASGRDRVELSFDEVQPYNVTRIGRRSFRMELAHTRRTQALPKQLNTQALSFVERVSAKQQGAALFIDVDLKGQAQQTTILEGRRLVWLFSGEPNQIQARRALTFAQEEVADVDEVTSGFERPVAEAAAEGDSKVVSKRKGRRYSGRTVDLDFKDADIHNILRLLSDIGGVNVVTSDDVQGTVTIRMRGVPWDQALDVVLQSKGLGMTRSGNLVRVAPIATLEKEREAAIARQKQREQLAPLETRLIPVSYAAAGELQPRVKELLSSRGTVSVDSRTNMLVVRDISENLDDVETLVRTLDTQTPQVLIEARIVEATSQYTKDIGVQWGGDFVMSTATGNPTGLAFPANIGLAGGNVDANTPTSGLGVRNAGLAQPNFAVNLPAITGTGQGGALGLTLGSLGGAVNLNVRLSAAEANGIVRIVSSPKILTLDNQEASIGQGTLIPFSQVSAQGVQTAFQEAKLELKVRPHVTSDGSVALEVELTRDEPDFTRTSPRGDPTILKREAKTSLLVSDGHTAVIGGIYTRNTGRNVDQIPFFGDIPILGILFQRRRVREERGELLIFLTPRIVNREAALRL